jgi:ABC-2 type transport system permease protein
MSEALYAGSASGVDAASEWAKALHSEWTKLRTVAGTVWLLVGTIVATVVVSTGTASAVNCSYIACRQDPVKLSLTGIGLGQAIIAILAVTAISGEYSTGMIRTTFTATPRRLVVLASKAVILVGVTLVTGTIAVFGSLLSGRLILPGKGFTAAHGYAPISLSDGSTLRAAVGSVLYLALIALLSLGVATMIRESAIGVGTVLGLLYLFPVIVQAVTDPSWKRFFQQIAPMNAGLAVQSTINLRNLPIAPWAGLGVLAAWAGGALLVGGLLLHFRDA